MENSLEVQLEKIKARTTEIVPKEELVQKIKGSIAKKKPLVIKLGFDPSSSDIHLGHVVVLRKLRDFQELGHRVVFVVGSFTGMIGDPSGQSETRRSLTREEVVQNAATYRRQVWSVLDPEKTEFVENHEWIEKLTARDFVALASKHTVARMLERDDFQKRFQGEQPIGIHEFLYPLLQAYDSVVLKADVELGGTDQKFNLLVGRELQRAFGQEPQVAILMPLLEGTDGVKKMSKSQGNFIGITDPPEEMYGKLMSITDDLMVRYYELLSTKTAAQLQKIREGLAQQTLHPKSVKGTLAFEIVSAFHGKEGAQRAEEQFEKVFVQQGVPDDVPNITIEAKGGTVWLVRLLVQAGCASSNAEARRLILQGGVTIEGERIEDPSREISSGESPFLLKVGKRKFRKMTLKKV